MSSPEIFVEEPTELGLLLCVRGDEGTNQVLQLIEAAGWTPAFDKESDAKLPIDRDRETTVAKEYQQSFVVVDARRGAHSAFDVDERFANPREIGVRLRED